MKHRCHAENCSVVVPPKMFMCRKHWFMLPKSMRDQIWFLYRPGQEISKQASLEYLEYAQVCVDYIANKEN